MFSDQSCVNRTEAVFLLSPTVWNILCEKILFPSYSFGIEKINMFTLRSSLENYTRFQTKMGKAYSDQNDTKTLPGWAGHTYMSLVREYPPPSPRPHWEYYEVSKLIYFCFESLQCPTFSHK